jgi:hypothetical protein
MAKPTQNFSLYLDAHNAEQLRARMVRTGQKVGEIFLNAMLSAADAEKRMAVLQAQVEDQAAEIARLEAGNDDTDSIAEARYQEGVEAGRAAAALEQSNLRSEIMDLRDRRAQLTREVRTAQQETESRRMVRQKAHQEGYDTGLAQGMREAPHQWTMLQLQGDEQTMRQWLVAAEQKVKAQIRKQAEDQVTREVRAQNNTVFLNFHHAGELIAMAWKQLQADPEENLTDMTTWIRQGYGQGLPASMTWQQLHTILKFCADVYFQ